MNTNTPPRYLKKKIQKRIIGRAAKTKALFEKRQPHAGDSLLSNYLWSKAECDCMRLSWGPLTKGPYRKP